MLSDTSMYGKLVVHVSEAKELRSRELIGHNDPYVELVLGTESGKTQVHMDGGSVGVWNETITLDWHANITMLDVTVYDKDHAKLDDLIGRTSIALHDTVANKSTDAWYALTSRKGDKNAGSIHLKIEFIQDSARSIVTLPSFNAFPTGLSALSHGPLGYPSH